MRGVKIRRVAGCRRGSGRIRQSPSSPPLCPPTPVVSGSFLWARGACTICQRKLRVKSNLSNEYCEGCLSELFPFNSITNDRQFREALNSFFDNCGHLDKASQLLFNPLCDQLKDTLVDLNRTIGSCDYYDEKQFCKMNNFFRIRNGGQLSVLCHNINGLPKKRDEVELLLETLDHNFDILGFTETH